MGFNILEGWANKINLLLSFLLFWAAGAGIAHAKDTYQSEIIADYYHSKYEDHGKYSRYSLDTKIHFSAVNTAGHPLAEAAFLERIGSIRFFVGKTESKFSGTELRGPRYGTSLVYRKPDLPVVFEAGYTRTDADYRSSIHGDNKSDTYSLGVGYFLRKSLLAQVDFTHAESNTKINSPISLSSKAKLNSYSLTGKYVQELGNGAAYNVSGLVGIWQQDSSRSSRKTNRIYGIASDYYFNRNISLGANFTLDSGESKSNEGKTVGLRLVTFLTKQFAINLGYSRFYADNDEGRDRNTYYADMTIRF